MKAEGCREWRESLGAYALGHLRADERAGLEAHLEGCAECRAELSLLAPLVRVLPLADPDRIDAPAPLPPSSLGDRIAVKVGEERRAAKRKRARLRLGMGGVAAAAAAAVLAIFVLSGNGGSSPEQRVAFRSLPPGVKIAATLQPHAFGTEIHMYVSGVRSGTLCRVFLRASNGARVPAGSFRYRWGEDSKAVLSSALDLSRTEAIGVRAGNRTFVAPVDDRSDAAIPRPNSTEEDET